MERNTLAVQRMKTPALYRRLKGELATIDMGLSGATSLSGCRSACYRARAIVNELEMRGVQLPLFAAAREESGGSR